jgi:glycosyltransferase involved in cell wall biosynthesis
MDVSVIVPAWNEEKCIESCLKAINAQNTRVEYEIIVCDAESRDKTLETARRYADKIVTVEAHSPAISRNRGAEEATGEYLVFVDADTILPPEYLERVVEKFRDHELMGFSAGFIFSNRSEKLIFTEKITNSYLRFRDTVGLTTLVGFNIAVRKEAFNAVNGFRDVPLEDGEFSIRMRKSKKIRYFTDFYVITSSRRLDEMGLLGTIRYYLEMDLARRDPNISRLLLYNKYLKCTVDDLALQKEFARIFNSRTSLSEVDITVRDYIQKKAGNLREIMHKMTREQFATKITEISKSIADLKLMDRISKMDVDRAIKLIKKKS